MWGGNNYSDKTCGSNLSDWVSAVGALLFLISILWLAVTLISMLEHRKSAYLILALSGLWLLCVVCLLFTFIAGHFIVFSTDAAHCYAPLYSISESAIILLYVYVFSNVALEIARRRLFVAK